MIHPVALRLALGVAGLFFLVIVVWVTVYRLAGTVDTHRMTPSEEAQLLERRGRNAVAPTAGGATSGDNTSPSTPTRND